MKEEDGSITFMWVTVTTPLDVILDAEFEDIIQELGRTCTLPRKYFVLSAPFDVLIELFRQRQPTMSVYQKLFEMNSFGSEN